jgi:Holliday junction resolvase RusA-like endonuclease
MIEFTIEGVPVPKGRPRARIIGKGRAARVQIYTPDETIAAERMLRITSMRHRPRKPLDGPLHVTTVFVVPSPARVAAERSKVWPQVRPDDDNYRKLVLDALNEMFWHDDGQICGGESWKFYGSPPRTYIRIRPLTNADASDVRAMIGEPDPQEGLF